jgi:MerR family transcriptional regulator/heat shock protein HspR
MVARRKGGDPEPNRGVYMISVAAELAGMHPQTLRIYEARGLITPSRSAGKTRLYSQDDVDRLRRIQAMTSDLGVNLAGVEKVFELEEELGRMRSRMERLQERTTELEREMQQEIERVKKQFRAEVVRYEPPGNALMPVRRQTRRRSQ